MPHNKFYFYCYSFVSIHTIIAIKTNTHVYRVGHIITNGKRSEYFGNEYISKLIYCLM